MKLTLQRRQIESGEYPLTQTLSEVYAFPYTFFVSNRPEKVFVSEQLMLIPEDTELPPNYVQKW